MFEDEDKSVDSEKNDSEDQDNKEDQNEEDSDSEDNSDNEDDSSSSDEDGDSGDADSEEDRKASRLRLTNPKKYPKELQPLVRKLNQQHTQRFQEFAAIRKQAESFKRLVSLPQFKEWWASQTSGKPPDKTDKSTDKDTNGDKDGDALENTIARVVGRMLDEKLAPHNARLKKDEAREFDESVSKEKKDLTEKFPMWENYKPDMSEVIDKYETKGIIISYEDAFKIAAFEDAFKGGAKRMADLIRDKKSANGNRNSNNNKKIEKDQPIPKDITEAFNQAWDELSKKGMKLGV